MAFEHHTTTGEGQEHYRGRLLRTIEHVAPPMLRDRERDMLPAYEALTRWSRCSHLAQGEGGFYFGPSV